jgi:hypothetical protein
MRVAPEFRELIESVVVGFCREIDEMMCVCDDDVKMRDDERERDAARCRNAATMMR